MELTNNDLALEILERIELIHEHINAVDAATSMIQRGQRSINVGDIRHLLIEKELEEWRNLFMWALTLDQPERDRIKAAAHERFLSDKMHVAHWFSDGETPGRWLQADEEAFREMARKVFGPKEE